MELNLKDLECLMGLLGSRPCKTEETDLYNRLEKEKAEMMSLSDGDLDHLISLIRSLPYRPLKTDDANLLERIKAVRMSRPYRGARPETSALKKVFCIVAKEIVKIRENPEIQDDVLVQPIISLLACQIGNALARHIEEFNSELFLHTCGVKRGT